MKKILFSLNFFLSLSMFAQYNVQTISGNGTAGHNDGNILLAQYNRPVGITSDSQRNIYICDFYNHCIRKISVNGTVTTIAGMPGVSGMMDGTSARFNQPGGICVDDLGNIYVTDNLNHRICKIDANNNVTTLAGNGSIGYVDSTGTAAKLNQPRDLCYKASDTALYFVDRNNVIRKLNLNTNEVTTFSGSGSIGFANGISTAASFNFPASIDNDNNGGFIVTDRDNHAIRKLSSTGTVSTLSGNGSSGYIDGNVSSAKFNRPVNASVDTMGNIFVTDFSNRRIRMIGIDDTVRTVAGDGSMGFQDGSGSTAKLGEVFDLEILNNNAIIFTDASNERIRALTNLTTSIETVKIEKSEVNLYPNPATNFIHVEFEKNSEFNIYDSKGRLILNGFIKSEKKHIDISSFDQGLYFVSIINSNGVLNSKTFVKIQ